MTQAILARKEELIRLQTSYQHWLELIGKQFSGRKSLKVIDFATEKESLYIQKLYVKCICLELYQHTTADNR